VTVEILSPENGSWVPVEVKEITVTGAVHDPAVTVVRVSRAGEVPVVDGRFEARVRVTPGWNIISAKIPAYYTSPSAGNEDTVTVCTPEEVRGLVLPPGVPTPPGWPTP
jgi:hypothetical protein